MKKLKTILTVLFIISLIGGLWYNNSNKNTFKTTEFLFDTTCTVTAYGSGAKDATKEAFSLIEEIHSLTNYFSDTSDVQRINSSKLGESIIIDKMTADIIKCAIEISKETDGNYNEDYCKWCYTDGAFAYESKDGLLEFLISHMPNPDNTPGEVRKSQYDQYLSQLKHWK